MDVVEVSKLLVKNKNYLCNEDNYKRVINMGKNTYRYDLINRILIDIQFKNAFDLRTKEEWALVGRQTKDKAVAVYVLLPKYKVAYISNLSGKEMGNELSSEELERAVGYNIVTRVNDVDNIEIKEVYDVSQTRSVTDKSEKLSRPRLDDTGILSLVRSLTGYDVKFSDMTYVSKSAKTVFVNNSSYGGLRLSVSEAIQLYYSDTDIKMMCNEHGIEVLDSRGLRVFRESLRYALLSLMGIEKDVDLSEVESTPEDMVFNIANLVNRILCDVSIRFEMINSKEFMSAEESIKLAQEAEFVLSVLDSYKVYKQLYS